MIRNTKKIMVMLMLVSCFLWQGITYSRADEPTDVTGQVDFGTVNVYVKGSSESEPQYIIKDDVLQQNAPIIKVNNSVHFLFNWEITVSQLQQMKIGDYFYVTLPEYFSFSNSTTPSKLLNKSNEEIGILELVEHEGKKKLKATLGTGAFENIGLEEGYLNAVGMANEARENIEVGQGSRPTITIEGNGSGTGTPLPSEGFDENQVPLQKTGYSNALTGSVKWTMQVFKDNYVKVFNGATPTFYKNVIFEDQLSADQTVATFSLLFQIFPANNDGKMSGYAIGNIPMENLISNYTITKLVQMDNERADEFEDRIRNANTLCYGITSDNKLVANLGDMPNLTGDTDKGFLIKNNFMSELDKILVQKVNDGSLTQERADLTRVAYQRILDEGQGGVFWVTIAIDTHTTKENGEEIVNKALVSWAENTQGVESEEIKLTVQKISGGASGIPIGTLLIVKQDGDDDSLLPKVGFVLEIEDNGSYKIINEYETNIHGEITISGLVPGKYRIKELYNSNPLYGSQIEFKPAGTTDQNGYYYFELQNNAINGLKITAYNYREHTKTVTGSVRLVKTDRQNGELLANAEFKLCDGDGVLISEDHKTDTNGLLMITNLLPGKYQLIETKAPNGYQLDSTPQYFEISEQDSQAVTISMTNSKLIESTEKVVHFVEVPKTANQSGILQWSIVGLVALVFLKIAYRKEDY